MFLKVEINSELKELVRDNFMSNKPEPLSFLGLFFMKTNQKFSNNAGQTFGPNGLVSQFGVPQDEVENWYRQRQQWDLR